MNTAQNFLSSIVDRNSVITAIDNSIRFPEILHVCNDKYEDDINTFIRLVNECSDSNQLLKRIRTTEFNATTRMSLLKIFRRCVSPIIDTEMAKKIQKVTSESLISNYGYTFKPINELRNQFNTMDQITKSSLAALIGEYDTRGQSGYLLTDQFFDWFERSFSGLFSIEGPRGAGRDIELSEVFPEYSGTYPCDFVIRDVKNNRVLAVGFARYDSTRGGAQSDDRTGGNANKVDKAIEFCRIYNKGFKLLFLSDGPGLAHRDTWDEACALDGRWNGNVRVTTLKTASVRVTPDWLLG